MTAPQPLASSVSVFRDDEPVIGSHPLLGGARPPVFATRDCWDLNGVVRRPANQRAANWRIHFEGLDPVWNVRAREQAMIWLNPRHPAILRAGLHLKPEPCKISTARMRAGHLRALAAWATEQGLSSDLAHWTPGDLHRYLDDLRQRLAPASLPEHLTVIRALHTFAPVLAGGGLTVDPWAGRSNRRVTNAPPSVGVTTPAIVPETWFPLVRSAWTYVNDFGPDILAARARWQHLTATARRVTPTQGTFVLEGWLAEPTNHVPVRAVPGFGRPTGVSWSLLSLSMGIALRSRIFALGHEPGRRNRTLVEQVVAEGRTQAGLLAELRHVDRPDGTRGPWHQALHLRALWLECVALRNACYIVVAALSMMRDSEIREITKGGVVEHYGAPAVTSIKHKRDPNLPTKHWWIIEPAAQAIATAAELSLHDDLAFAAVRPGAYTEELFGSQGAISSFIRHVAAHRHVTGLPNIPEQRLTPHMFRRTMAMLTADYPGAEIAVGMQLKHVATRALANRSTEGYMARTPAWAAYFDDAQATARIRRLRDLYDAHHRGEVIGYGPGADRLADTFNAIAAQADRQARNGDARVEHDLLRRTQIPIRFGKLNHCTLDDRNPLGAKCLENTIVPDGHHGPLIDRCQPGRCANSVIAPEHLPTWQAEHTSLVRLLDNPKLPAARRAQLEHQLGDVDAVIRRAEP